MEWIGDLLLGLAAPAAGVFGAWFGGRGVVQQARVNAEAARDADRERHDRERHERERERRDSAERELRSRAEALILAVAEVRNLPEESTSDAKEQSEEYRRGRIDAVYSAAVSLWALNSNLWSEAHTLADEAEPGMSRNLVNVTFPNAVAALMNSVEAEVTKLG
jgi:hypothetical protein